MPEESAVAYSGKELFDLLMTFTETAGMRTKVRDMLQGTRKKVHVVIGNVQWQLCRQGDNKQ